MKDGETVRWCRFTKRREMTKVVKIVDKKSNITCFEIIRFGSIDEVVSA